MNNKKLERGFELYKILNLKVNEESREFYVVNGVFLVLIGALFGFFSQRINSNSLEEIIILLFGLAISFCWALSLSGQMDWKNFWCNKLINIEQILQENDDSNIWEELNNKRKDEEVWGDYKMFEKLKKIGIWQELKGKGKGFGVTKYIKLISVLFIISWFVLLCLKVYNYSLLFLPDSISIEIVLIGLFIILFFCLIFFIKNYNLY